MKKLSLIVGSMTVMVSSAAFAQISCTPTPSCAEMGYTQSASSCVGDYLKCPYDTSKAFCVNCPDQCNELGFTKTATGGVYDCAEGQTVNKCKTNSTKYKCDGTACSYGYKLYSNLGPDPYGGKGCTQASTYGNTSCYMWRDNSAYFKKSRDYMECLAASYTDYGDFVIAQDTYTGGVNKDACGNATYKMAYYCMKTDCMGYNCDTSSCGWSTPTCTNKTWYYGSYDDSGYQDDCTQNICVQIAQDMRYGGEDHYYTYTYNGEDLKFSEYCYKKYNLTTRCGGIKYSGYTIPWDYDYRGW